jgi:hypothetical protein
MFKPLSTSYILSLTSHLQRSQGLVPVREGDFFPVFRDAWVSSFKRDLIIKAYSSTGIGPMEKNRLRCRFYFNPEDGGFIIQNTSESRASVFLTSCLAKDCVKVEIGKCQALQKDTWNLGTRSQPQVFVFRIVDPYTAQQNDRSILQRRNPLTFGSLTPPGRYDLQGMCHLGGPDWNTLRKKIGSNSVYVAYHSALGDVVVKSMWTPALKPTDLVGKICSWVKETSIHRTLYHVCCSPACKRRTRLC